MKDDAISLFSGSSLKRINFSRPSRNRLIPSLPPIQDTSEPLSNLFPKSKQRITPRACFSSRSFLLSSLTFLPVCPPSFLPSFLPNSSLSLPTKTTTASPHPWPPPPTLANVSSTLLSPTQPPNPPSLENETLLPTLTRNPILVVSTKLRRGRLGGKLLGGRGRTTRGG